METGTLLSGTFLHQILDTMADGLFTLDKTGRITSWNRSMERISGYSAKEAVGNTCGLIECSRCFGQSCPSDINECGVLRHGASESKECHIKHKKGENVPVIKNARLVTDEDGSVLGIVETITDLSELNRIKKRVEEAERRLGERHRLGNLIGKSGSIKAVFEAINAASDSRATVLVQGESGTGKELVAGAIHYNSAQAEYPMVTVNCSALSETLLESELFGHVKGAFTGAHKDRIGRFEEADKGTVFLDEIGELSAYMQVKLLRVLQEREIERVGDSRRRKINIRVIAATHQNLYELVKEGRFREDLFYRLKVFPITVPPLRERREDIPLLVRHFIDKGNRRENRDIKHTDPAAMKRLMAYHWPGNVRELENAVEHAFVICRSETIELADLPPEIARADPAADRVEPGMPASFEPRAKLTRRDLLNILDECGWNKAEAARRIGKSRTAVWKYMKKWDIPLQKPE